MGKCETCAAYCWNICMPCRLVIGVAAVLFSLLLVASITIHLVDQATHGQGYQNGFTLAKRTMKNPIGIAFDTASKVFPFDYVLLAVVILWMFVATLYGVTQIGTRFFCFRLYDFRAGKTPHNGLLMAIWFVMFTVLALNVQLLSLAPNYAQFGHQFYLPGSSGTDTATAHAPCSMGVGQQKPPPAPEGAGFPSTFNKAYNTPEQISLRAHYPDTYLCAATQLYGFYTGIQLNMPLFGLIFFVAQWLFLVSYLYGLFSVLFCKQNNLSAEEQALLEGKPQVESIFY